jgi:Copper amine oxidase N-terminal domain
MLFMKKHTVTLALSLLLALGGGVVQAQTPETEQPAFTVVVEGQQIVFDAAPFLQNDRLYVPLRTLSEALGASVQYEPLEDIATISKGDTRLVMNFRTGDVTRNDQPFPMEAKPRLVEDRAMVPLRFVGEAFDELVDYKPATGTITLAPSPETLAKRQAIRAVWMDSLTKMSQQSGYRMNFVSTRVEDKKVDESHSVWEYQRDPFLMHGTLKQEPETDVYFVQNAVWVRNTPDSHWQQDSFGPDEYKPSLQLSGLMPLTESEVDLLLPFATMKEGETTRVLTIHPSRYAYAKWMLSNADQPESQSPEALYGLSSFFQTASIEYTIDKNTGLLVNSKSSMVYNVGVESNQIRYYDFGLLPPTAAPDFEADRAE